MESWGRRPTGCCLASWRRQPKEKRRDPQRGAAGARSAHKAGAFGPRFSLLKNPRGFGDAMQFAKVALRRPVGPSWRSLAHWASASLLPPLAALGFAPTEAFVGFGGAR